MQDVAHKVCVHPSDGSVVDVNDLKEVVVVWVSRATSAVENLAHPPVVVEGFSRHGVVLDNHQVTGPDVQKSRLLVVDGWARPGTHRSMSNTSVLSTSVLCGNWSALGLCVLVAKPLQSCWAANVLLSRLRRVGACLAGNWIHCLDAPTRP